MSNIISIAHLHPEFQTLSEWKDFAEKQLLTIAFLKESNDRLTALVASQVAELAASRALATSQASYPVEKIIVSPERALLDEQILLIGQRSYGQELSLEDVKKLDLLLKNQRACKEAVTLDGKVNPAQASSADLLKIIQAGN